MRVTSRLLFLASASALVGAPSLAQRPATATAANPAAAIARDVRIPHQMFRLANGLTVLVHTDRKAPVVALSMWYNVGSKDEPKGKSGFAHLFEHLMFYGSENMPGNALAHFDAMGATDLNGTTWFDRTNYFATVPLGSLERALFLESDRMGWLLGAVNEATINAQRGVVQNEKRGRDNGPGGLVSYAMQDHLFRGTGYAHSTIGSMADLDAATMADVHAWFRQHYGPNNAVLVLAGDIDVPTARRLTEKYFGPIPRGPVHRPAMATPRPLAKPTTLVMKDRVPTTTIMRYYPVPGIASPQAAALDIGASILGGLASSRLDRDLVRAGKGAVSANAGFAPWHRLGWFDISATVRPGADAKAVAAELDRIVADFLAKGPTQDEIDRAVTTEMAARVRGLEQVGGFGGKAVTLAEGQLYAGRSDFYRQQLDAYARLTPAAVRSAMQQWLSKPALTILLEPGERPPYQEAALKERKIAAAPPPKQTRTPPPLTESPALSFPAVSRSRLSNGVELIYARQTTVPVTRMQFSFDAGTAADAPGKAGQQALLMDLIDEGAGHRDAQALAEERERLGLQLSSGAATDRSTLGMTALSAKLAPSLDLVADILQRPTFPDKELARLKTQYLTALAQARTNPNSMAARAMAPLLYGEGHPYAARPGGEEAAFRDSTRADLVALQTRWLRPDKMKIFITSDRPLAEIAPLLEARFGTWRPAGEAGVKAFRALPPRPGQQSILLVDRPGSPSSVIYAAQMLPTSARDLTTMEIANEIIGGNSISRINQELREVKNWSYGTYSGVGAREKAVNIAVQGQVQTDRTADSILAVNEQFALLYGTKPPSADEMKRMVDQAVLGLPGTFETSAAVLAQMARADLYGRPDDEPMRMAARYRGLTVEAVQAEMKRLVDPKGLMWVVVGDAAKVRPQLEKAGLTFTEQPAR